MSVRLSVYENGGVTAVPCAPSFDETCDILIVGLGTAGAAAALAAAKTGKSVIGVEKSTSVGGLGTGGCVWDYFYGARGGLFETIDGECLERTRGAYVPVDYEGIGRGVSGALKAYLTEARIGAYGNCKLFYETVVTGVLLDGRTVVGAKVFSHGETRRISCKVLIDGTGNAACAAHAGCAFRSGRAFDGAFSKVSKGIVVCENGFARGTWAMCGINRENTAKELSDIALHGMAAPPCLREHYEAKDRVLYDAALLGVREFPCVVAEEPCTFGDFLRGKRTEEPLFFCAAPPDGCNEKLFEDEDALILRVILYMNLNAGVSFGVPRGVMIPKGFDGILVASRACGTGHEMQGALRMKRDLQKLGEAAAATAAAAVDQGCGVRAADYKTVAGTLRAWDVLREEDDMPFARFRCGDMQFYEKGVLPHTAADVRAALSGEDACAALLALIRADKTFLQDELRVWSRSDDRLLALHSAIALGLRGDRFAVDVLERTVREPVTVPTHNIGGGWMYYIPDFTRCALLLGLLGEPGAVGELFLTLDTFGQNKYEGVPNVPGYRDDAAYARHFVYASLSALMLMHGRCGDAKTKRLIEEKVSAFFERGDVFGDPGLMSVRPFVLRRLGLAP